MARNRTTMASLQALASVLFLLVVACASKKTWVEHRCANYAAEDESAYDFCFRTLGTDRESATADDHGLVAIAIRKARASAKATGARITGLLGVETTPARRGCLAKCAAEYAAAVRRLGHAAKGVARGGAGLPEAEKLLGEVNGTPARCERAFKAAGQRSPLDAVERDLDSVLYFAQDFLDMPLKSKPRM